MNDDNGAFIVLFRNGWTIPLLVSVAGGREQIHSIPTSRDIDTKGGLGRDSQVPNQGGNKPHIADPPPLIFTLANEGARNPPETHTRVFHWDTTDFFFLQPQRGRVVWVVLAVLYVFPCVFPMVLLWLRVCSA